MTLLTISDLSKPDEVLWPLIDLAKSLKPTYLKYIDENQNDTYSYQVDEFGSKGRSPGIHASEMKCERAMTYSVMGVERRVPEAGANTNMLMRFRIGTAVHAMLQNDWHRIAAKSGGRIKFEDEVKINPKLQEVAAFWDLHSSCDGVITVCDELLNPLVRIGLEIKTESDDQFKKLTKPRPDHIEQTTFYQAVLDLPLMWTFYYNKSNSNIVPADAPWLYKFNHKLWEENLEMRFARVHHAAGLQQPLPRKEGQHCTWCPFGYVCQPTRLKSKGPPVISQGMKRRS